MTLKDLWKLLQETWNAWSTHRASRSGAALAYYTTFSLAPLLVIVIAVAALVFGQEAAQGKIVTEIQGVVGVESARAIQAIIDKARTPAARGALASACRCAARSSKPIRGESASKARWAWARPSR